jgi:hypothetical protein
MLKQRLFKTTPFFIFYILGLLTIFYQFILQLVNTERWGYLAIFSIMPVVAGMIVVDVVLKGIVRKVKWIWLIEGFLCLGLIYLWIII